jgi:hypothetical protein
MATISNTPRPGYVWDSADNVWYPIGVGAHGHTADSVGAIANTLVDAKGDLLTATADNTPARIAVGANNTVLTADSSTATGLKWAAPVPTVTWVRLTSGTSWSVPSGIKTATIWTIAGGGGGGSARGDGNKYGGGGGGAGGLQMGTFDLSSVAGSTIAYAIGAGGAGGAQSTGAGNNGTNGGNTTFGTSGQAWYLSSTGGGGGKGGNGVGLVGGCAGGNGGATAGGAAGGGGGGIGTNAHNAGPQYSTEPIAHGTQAGSGGFGGSGTNGILAGLGGAGMFINNYGVGGGGVGGCVQNNNYTVGTVIWGAALTNVGAAGNASFANTGAGGPGGTNDTGTNTGYSGGNGGSGVIFIQYLS